MVAFYCKKERCSADCKLLNDPLKRFIDLILSIMFLRFYDELKDMILLQERN